MNPIDTCNETLKQWLTALLAAFDKAGFGSSYHPVTNGNFRLGELMVRKSDLPDQMYKIEFLRKTAIIAGQRVSRAEVSVYNPNGGLTVHLKGFAAAKVTKIVEYATKYVSDRAANEAAVELKRQRKGLAREQWSAAGIEMPEWMSANPNVNNEADLGTYHVFFHEHRDNFGLRFLSLDQVKRLSDFVKALAAEPMNIKTPADVAAATDADLAAKLLQHEGKAPLKYDKKADDKQWMHDTINP